MNYYIYHHLGLGDHFICNGLVRQFIDKNKLSCVSVVVKTSNLKNVQRMFKDRDELITALVYLSPSDIAQINYRRLVVIGNERYIISRIKDYNPANAEPTEVELVLVSDRGEKERLTH